MLFVRNVKNIIFRTGNEEPFSISYSLWFNLADYHSYLRSFSSRLIAMSWWMFILLMVSSYTANLAAFLTVDRMENPIKSVESLVQQNKIKFGLVGYKTTWEFLKVFSYFKLHRLLRIFHPELKDISI